MRWNSQRVSITGTSNVLPLYVTMQIRALEELGDRGEQRTLGGKAGEQELPHLKRPKIEISAADEERDRSRAAAQARRLQIDEDSASST